MKLTKAIKTIVAAALIAATALSAYAQAQELPSVQDEPGGPFYRPGELLIQFKGTVTDNELGEAFRQGALQLVKHIQTRAMKDSGQMGVSHATTRLPVRLVIRALENLPGIEFVEPNWVYTNSVSFPLTFDDPYYTGGYLWGIYGTSTYPNANEFGSGAANAWARGYTGSKTVHVGIIDTGIDVEHLDLKANAWINPHDGPLTDDGNQYPDDFYGWNFYGGNNVVFDAAHGDAHGTHVAGTIAASGANGAGVAGVNWNVNFIAAKFIAPGAGSTAHAIQAIDYFTELKTRADASKRINVVALNNSWGGGGYSQALRDAIVRAANADILFVASAGNGNIFGQAINTDISRVYPACYNTAVGTGADASYDSVISVTAIDQAGSKASWANYGATTVDLGAPGVDVWSSTPDDSYSSYDGTSMAAPHVTGAIALYKAAHPEATADQIKQALLASTTATSSLSGKTVTGGRLDIAKFLDWPQPPAAPPAVPAAPTGVTAPPPQNTEVALTWTDNSDNETGFRVTRTGGATPMTTIVAAGRTSYSDTGLAPNTTYVYGVSAFNAGGEATAVDEATVTTGCPPPPPTVVPLERDTATQGNWMTLNNGLRMYGNDGYNIINYAAGMDYPSYATVTVSEQTSYTWAASTSDVRALQKPDSATDRFASCWHSAPNYAPGSFTLDVNVNDTLPHRVALYALDWDNVSPLRSETFEVLDAANGNLLDTQTLSAFGGGEYVAWNIQGHVKIRISWVSGGNAVLSGIFFDAAAPIADPPAAPIGLTVSPFSSSQINLSWTDNATDETGYKIERLISGGCFTQVATVPANATSYSDTGLSAYTSYTYRVRAYNTFGNSGYSDEANATTGAPPPPPTIAPADLVATAVSPTQINLIWTDLSDNEAEFKIERSISGGTFTQVATVPANATSYSDTGLTSGTYTYQVRASNAGGDSPYSGPATAIIYATISFTSVSAQDGRIQESSENSNVGGSVVATDNSTSALQAGDAASDRQLKTFVSFNTSSLPDGATIVSATLKLKRGTVSGTNPFGTHGSCNVDIKGSTGFGGSTTLSAADFQAAADATQVATLSDAPSNGTWSTGLINSTGLPVINKTGTTQFRVYFALDDNDDNGSDYIGWYSGESSASNRPVLEIVYY